LMLDCHFRSRIERFQWVAAPCQALCFVSIFQMVKLQTEAVAGSRRNAVATFALRASARLGTAGGHSPVDFASSKAGAGVLIPNRRQLKVRYLSSGPLAPLSYIRKRPMLFPFQMRWRPARLPRFVGTGRNGLSGRSRGDVVFQLGFGKSRMTNLLTAVSSAKPREKSGAHTMARYGFQVHASILKMLELHQSGNDYRAVFDHFDDLMVFDKADYPENVDFYQIKSLNKGSWSLKQMTKKDARDRRLRPSLAVCTIISVPSGRWSPSSASFPISDSS
jgi:Cap4, dsDNA endonuclease domain